MRLLPLLPALALLSAPTLHAQAVSIYGTFSPIHLSGVINGNSNSSSGYSTTSFWNPGFGVGSTVNLIPFGPLKVGLDLRASIKPGTNGSDLILAGPRLGLKVPVLKFKPYIQASGGYLRIHPTLTGPIPSQTSTFAAYEILGGVDYPIAPFFDFRVIEVGGGKGYVLTSAGDPSNYTVNLFTINSGLVLHF